MNTTSPTPIPESQYGFYDRLKAEFPSQINVDLTEVCNLACIHCPHPEFKNSPYYDARYLEPALNRKMVDEVSEFGRGHTQYIRYTGEGEPLTHPKGYDMIEYAARNSGVFVTITTNGTIMNEKRTRKLIESGVHLIDISIDAHNPETYSKIRVNGDLNVTRGNVLNLLRWVKETKASTKVIVSFIEQPQNSDEAETFERFWKDAGADQVVIRRMHSAAGAVVNIAQLLRNKNQGEQRYPCLYPWERIVLRPGGELSFCPQDWVRGSIIADYRKTSIREVWQSDYYRKLRAAHLKNDFCDHKFCGQCPDWRGTRWPDQGASYADMIEEFNVRG